MKFTLALYLPPPGRREGRIVTLLGDPPQRPAPLTDEERETREQARAAKSRRERRENRCRYLREKRARKAAA